VSECVVAHMGVKWGEARRSEAKRGEARRSEAKRDEVERCSRKYAGMAHDNLYIIVMSVIV
jgi:hypothetical protein